MPWPRIFESGMINEKAERLSDDNLAGPVFRAMKEASPKAMFRLKILNQTTTF